MFRTRFITAAVIGMLAAGSAFALDLQSAKQQGLVGEKVSGYVGAVTHSSETDALVESINAKRKQAYMGISKENGQPLNVVETLAAKKLYDKLTTGEYYEAEDGSWKRK